MLQLIQCSIMGMGLNHQMRRKLMAQSTDQAKQVVKIQTTTTINRHKDKKSIRKLVLQGRVLILLRILNCSFLEVLLLQPTTYHFCPVSKISIVFPRTIRRTKVGDQIRTMAVEERQLIPKNILLASTMLQRKEIIILQEHIRIKQSFSLKLLVMKSKICLKNKLELVMQFKPSRKKATQVNDIQEFLQRKTYTLKA
jgi:hypothetical protein